MDFIVGKGVVSSEEHFQPFESVHNYIGNDNINECPQVANQ